MADLVFRGRDARDASLSDDDLVTLTAPAAVSPDAGPVAASPDGVVAIWCDESCQEIPAGAVLEVAGTTAVPRHGASALDVDVPVLVLVAEGTQVGSDVLTRAALMVQLGLATASPQASDTSLTGPLPR